MRKTVNVIMAKQILTGALIVCLVFMAFFACAGCTASSSQEPSTPADSSGSSSKGKEVCLSIDVDDAADRAALNAFLDSYTEAFGSSGMFEIGSLDSQTMAAFCADYLGLRNRDAIESGDYTDIAGPGGGAMGTSNARIAIDAVQDVAREYLGSEIDLQSISDPSEGYTYVDGYLYFGHTAPYGQIPHYPAVTAIESLGDGRYHVEFDILSGLGPFGYSRDGERLDLAESVFPLTSADMQGFLDCDVFETGEAVLSVEADDQGKKFTLESIRIGGVSRPDDGNPQPEDASLAPELEGVEFDAPHGDGLYTISFMTHPEATAFVSGGWIVLKGPVSFWDMESDPSSGESNETESTIAFKLNDQTQFVDERFIENDSDYAEMTRAVFEERLINGEFDWLSVRVVDGNAVFAGQTFYY